MAKNKFGGLIGGVFGVFAVAFAVVASVAGIKYVTEHDIFGGGSSEPSIITTSDDTTSEQPITSEDPITSENPNTSEVPVTSEPPVTSETPQPVNLSGEFPSPLFDGPYEDHILSGQTEIQLNLNPHIKPATISASSYGTHIGTTTQGYYRDNLGNTSTAVDFTINANSIRYDNTNLGYKLGFSDTTLSSNITINPIFYRDQNNTAYTYTSVLIYNFSIVSEDGWSFYVDSTSDLPITIYYRTNDDLDWKIGQETDLNYFGTDSFDLMPGVEMQLAIAFHSNSKSTAINPMNIILRLVASEQPLANEDGIYRIISYSNNFLDEEDFAGWEVVDSGVYGEWNQKVGLQKNGYYYIDLKENGSTPMLSLAIVGMSVGNFAPVTSEQLAPGVTTINLTYAPNELTGLNDFTCWIIDHRPFYASDFN